MSRTKKSRTPGIGSNGPAKEDRKKIAEPVAKKPKKTNGKQPGNRQQEANQQKQTNSNSQLNKDPRIGSKTPIVLTKTIEKVVSKPKKVKEASIAAIRFVESENALEQELYAIEDDEKLQVILGKQEDDTELSEQEVNYFNEKMERHQQLRESLGLHDDEDDDESSKSKSASENDLWDRLDNSKFSEFE